MSLRTSPGGTDKIDMQPRDCFIIEAPGGGFGTPAGPTAAE
jgi:N-methylhydantoinase B/oxoprolinase/acetone carboxylase alpha subunit